MQDEKQNFRHESLQDAKSIQAIFKALAKGLDRGQLSFADEDGEIMMEPEGLLDLKLTARRGEGRHRLTLRISWQVEEERNIRKSLKIK